MSLTCQREDGFYGPKLTCPPLPPQQYTHRNQDSSFVSPSILSPSLSLSSPTDRTRSTLWSNSTRWWYSFTRESWHSVFLDRHPHNESTIFNLHAAQFRVTQNGRRNETRAHSVSLPLPLNFQGGSIDRIESNRSIDRSDPIRSERYRRCVIGTRLVNRARYRDRDRRAWLRFVLSRADRSHCKHRSYRAIVAARVSHLYPSTDHFPVTCFVGYHSHRRGGEREVEKNRRSSILTARSRSISITQSSNIFAPSRSSKYTRYFSCNIH